MWKESSTRKVLPSKLASRRWLGWSGASLLAALLAALLGFLSTSSTLAGTAKLMAVLFALGFGVLLAVDLRSQKKPR